MTEKLDKYILDVQIDNETGEEHCTVLKTDGTTNMANWIEIVSAMYTHHSILEPLVDELNKISDDNEQLKQFQDRVFCWIDMHLQRLPTLRDNEFESDNEFADPSLYSGAIQILETMKKELRGDVE